MCCLVSPTPWSEAGLGLCPGQEAVLIRHSAVERYRSQKKTAPWANAQRVKVEGKEKEIELERERLKGRHNA